MEEPTKMEMFSDIMALKEENEKLRTELSVLKGCYEVRQWVIDQTYKWGCDWRDLCKEFYPSSEDINKMDERAQVFLYDDTPSDEPEWKEDV